MLTTCAELSEIDLSISIFFSCFNSARNGTGGFGAILIFCGFFLNREENNFIIYLGFRMASTLQQEISKAISSHNLWKSRLIMAIETGKIKEENPNEVWRDNLCDFGKWLYGDAISIEEKNSPFYKRVMILHMTFHQLAHKVLNLALTKKHAEASEILNHDFAKVSYDLIHEMMLWLKSQPNY